MLIFGTCSVCKESIGQVSLCICCILAANAYSGFAFDSNRRYDVAACLLQSLFQRRDPDHA
jgi:hypothetical protein